MGFNIFNKSAITKFIIEVLDLESTEKIKKKRV